MGESSGRRKGTILNLKEIKSKKITHFSKEITPFRIFSPNWTEIVHKLVKNYTYFRSDSVFFQTFHRYNENMVKVFNQI